MHDFTKLDVSDIKVTPNEITCNGYTFLLGGSEIFKGVSTSKGDLALAVPSENESRLRKSKNTTNEYTMILDNSPFYKDWPKRSKSFICSTAKSIAKGYSSGGNVYHVFPSTKSKIANTKQSDIWNARIPGLNNMILPNLNVIFDKVDFLEDATHNSDWGKWIEFGKLFDKMVASWEQNQTQEIGEEFTSCKQFLDVFQMKTRTDFLDQYRDGKFANIFKSEGFISGLQHLLSPKELGFELYDSARTAIDYCEVWVDGPCLFVHEDLYAKYILLPTMNSVKEGKMTFKEFMVL